MSKRTTSKYTKMDPLDHILHRPDMYIGSVKKNKKLEYISEESKDGVYIYPKVIECSNGIIRLYIEALSNAIDNVARSLKSKTPCTKIKINIDIESGLSSVWNDGATIPIEKDEKEGCYNHTLIFGHLLTSSNYNDEEERIDISGKNGIGGKAVNVFSKEFKVSGYEEESNLYFTQVWKDNMKNVNEPKIIESKKYKKGFTCVEWRPDFSRLGGGYTDDIISLYRRFAIDAAMLTKVKVYFNDTLLPVKNPLDYAKLFYKDRSVVNKEILSIKTKDCEVVITPSSNNDFQCVSFASGIYTKNGGSHVDPWLEAIFRPILSHYNKDKNKPNISLKDIKNFFRLVIVASVKNPCFESQEKSKLEAPIVKADIKTSHIKQILKWDSITSKINDIIKSKELLTMKKIERKKKGFTKVDGLDPANNAGGKHSSECTLILCEGLSAKTYAVQGIEVGVFDKKGRDWFGIYALKGKLLNVRDKTTESITKNVVINDLIKAMGARCDLDYTIESNFKTLQYGKILILTDQDSVTGDTPILLKNCDDNLIKIKNIDSVGKDWKVDISNGKEYSNTNKLVWTEKGWTKIKAIMRHKVTKNIYRVITHTGIVDVTEDHSLLDSEGVKITPQESKVGNYLLHSFPTFYENIQELPEDLDKLSVRELWKYASLLKIQYYQSLKKDQLIHKLRRTIQLEPEKLGKTDKNITLEMAYTMGLFFADGSCGIYEWKYNKKPKNRQNVYTFNRKSFCWSITNTNLDYINRAKDCLDREYADNHIFSIIEDKTHQKKGYCNLYKLILNGGKITENFINKWRKMFYYKKYKKIPTFILNSIRPIREAFFNGMYDGDGNKTRNTKTIDVFHKIGAQSVFLLCKSLGYEVSINFRDDKPDVFRLTMTKGHQQNNPYIIKKIINMGKTEQYVYDIETENHHFQAGIGQLIVHNTDGLHISGLIQNTIHYLFPSLLNRKECFITSMQTPLVKVMLSKNKNILFYDEDEYNEYATKFKKENPNFKLNKKYYKGLGTSNSDDIMNTFGKKMLKLKSDKETGNSMNKVFNKKYAENRKKWILEYDPDFNMLSWNGDDKEEIEMCISDFLETEVVKFSIDDNKRSLPHLMDGLKESLRKILYSCFLRKLKYSGKTLKVAQLAGYVAEKSSYHHGEQILYETITKMAHDFPGSNNIPLLYRDGQFGCLDPNTPILMWDMTIKNAKDIVVGDKLVGDDGSVRNVLKITSGEDYMYKICRERMNDYIVNSKHILTLKFSGHKSIFWKESTQRWTMNYFCHKTQNFVSKSIGINSKKDKQQAFIEIQNFSKNIPDSSIVDIKIQDYLNLPKYIRDHLKGTINNICVQKEYKEVDIDPYIFGCWLGDGMKDGHAFSSIDEEIIKSWVIWLDKIGCEVVHVENYKKDGCTYYIRRRGSSKNPSIGDSNYNSDMCKGCLTSNRKTSVCNWKINKNTDEYKCLGITCNGSIRSDLNPFKELLKKNNLYKNKYIPSDYILNDENTRLQLLAGLIDTDGTLRKQKDNYRFEISQGIIHYNIIKDADIIARSLGYNTSFYTNNKNIITLSIMGDISKIPTKVKRKIVNTQKYKIDPYCHNINVIPIGKGKFNGWSVDGNERFLLADSTITHNSRIAGGKDAANARYIFTKLDKLTRLIYREDDDEILDYIEEENHTIEPKFYVPIIPMILINGGSGIGTGWSSNIPSYNPLDIINSVKIWINNLNEEKKVDLPELTPWYRGYNGNIYKDKNKYISNGIVEEEKKKKVVTELPIGMWTDTFKENLDKLLENKNIKSVKNYSSPNKVKFIITETPDGIICNNKTLKLQTHITTSNMVLWDENNKIKKYKNINDIIENFCNIRLFFYTKRKNHILNKYKQELKFIFNKKRFLSDIISNKLSLYNKGEAREEEDLIKDLENRNYDKLYDNKFQDENDNDDNNDNNGYNYLLRIHIRSFTKSKLNALIKEYDSLKEKINTLENTLEKDIWLKELDEFINVYNLWIKDMNKIKK